MLALALGMTPARAQQTGSLLSSSIVVSNATTTSLGTATVAQVPYRGASLTLMPRFAAEQSGGTSSSNVVFTFNLSRDGVTYTTTDPLSFTIGGNGTNPVVGIFVFPATNFANDVRWIKWTKLATAQTNNVTISGLDWSCSPAPFPP